MSGTMVFDEQFAELVKINKQMGGGNVTPESVTDELGRLTAMERALSKKVKFLKEWLKNEAEQEGVVEYEGELFVCNISEVEQERISTQRVREILSEEQLAEVTGVTSYKKITFVRRPQS